ncbi:GNAT family N-acetyltransferase [Holzapfeliella sp. JNUCC 80]
MKIEIKKTNELTIDQLLTIMKERVKVFVVEQQSPYQEVDDADDDATHVMFWTADNELAAYARILEKEHSVNFGRVLVPEKFRKQKLGRKLIEVVLDQIKLQYPQAVIKIAAQSYLNNFYGSYGFEQTSKPYLEDGIEHIDMVLE